MRLYKTIHFRKLFMFVLFAGLTLTSCNDSSTSAIEEEDSIAKDKVMELATSGSNNTISSTQVSNNTVIDDFNSGAVVISACGHNAFDYHESTTIIGGARELTVRDAWSCTLGGKAYAEVDVNTGTLEWYVIGRTAPNHSVQYGTEIGTRYESWSPSPNLGKGSQLNLDLALEDSILIEATTNGGTSVWLRDGSGSLYGANITLSAGANTISLSSFQNLTESAATDIDGISFSGGLHTFELFAIKKSIGDTTPPVISYNQETTSLWPPNYKMVLVATGISASDNVDGSTPVDVTVSSNEPSNGRGDGNTDSDYDVVTNPDGTQDVYVRAERSGKGNGRTYTITMSSSDTAGNSSLESFEVDVAKSQGRAR